MLDMLDKNKDLIEKLKELKNKLLDIHINSNSTMSAVSGIVKIKKISDELKEVLILLHTNNVTEMKYTKETLLHSQNEILDVIVSVVEAQNVILKDFADKTPNVITTVATSRFSKILNTIATSPKLLGGIFILFFILGTMITYKIYPENTKEVLSSFRNIIKLLLPN